MQAALPQSNGESFSYNAADELTSALTISPEQIQAYLNQLRYKGSKHSKARALRGKARIAKRKAARK